MHSLKWFSTVTQTNPASSSKWKSKKKKKKKKRSENIWTIYSNTLWIVSQTDGQWAVVENGRWRHGKDAQGVFFPFLVMGCQNGFDLLRDLLIINCIICFLLHSSQESKLQRFIRGLGKFISSEKGLDGNWRCRPSADGSPNQTSITCSPKGKTD